MPSGVSLYLSTFWGLAPHFDYTLTKLNILVKIVSRNPNWFGTYRSSQNVKKYNESPSILKFLQSVALKSIWAW